MNRLKKSAFARKYDISRSRVTQLTQEGRLGTIGEGRKQEINMDDPLTLECIESLQENKALRAHHEPKTVHFSAGNIRFQTLSWPNAHDHLLIETLYPLSEGILLIEKPGAGGVAITQSGRAYDVVEQVEGRQGCTWKRYNSEYPAFPTVSEEMSYTKVKSEPPKDADYFFIRHGGQWLPIRGYNISAGLAVQTFFPLPEMIGIFTPDGDWIPWVEDSEGKRFDLYAGVLK